MLLDALLRLSNAQAITADAVSTNCIDLGNVTPKNDPFLGSPMCLVFSIDVAADFTTGNETYVFQAIVSATADTLTSPTVVAQREIIAGILAISTIHILTLPPIRPTAPLRYFGVNYDVGGTTPLLTVTTYLTPLASVGVFTAYAKGWTIA